MIIKKDNSSSRQAFIRNTHAFSQKMIINSKVKLLTQLQGICQHSIEIYIRKPIFIQSKYTNIIPKTSINCGTYEVKGSPQISSKCYMNLFRGSQPGCMIYFLSQFFFGLFWMWVTDRHLWSSPPVLWKQGEWMSARSNILLIEFFCTFLFNCDLFFEYGAWSESKTRELSAPALYVYIYVRFAFPWPVLKFNR